MNLYETQAVLKKKTSALDLFTRIARKGGITSLASGLVAQPERDVGSTVIEQSPPAGRLDRK